MNTRHHRDHRRAWFGGGADMTPDLSRRTRHRPISMPRCKTACDRHDADCYTATSRSWCDEYFYLPAPQRGARHRRHLLRQPQQRRLGRGLRLHPRRRRGLPATSTRKIVRRHMNQTWTRAERDRAALVKPRPLRRVQPALRPRHPVRPEDRRQHRGDPDVPAARGDLALAAITASDMSIFGSLSRAKGNVDRRGRFTSSRRVSASSRHNPSKDGSPAVLDDERAVGLGDAEVRVAVRLDQVERRDIVPDRTPSGGSGIQDGT